MLQYILCAARFGHCIKVIGREKVGSTTSATECRRLLQDWLNQYTTASSGTSESLKAKYPLGESQVQISEVPGRLALFNCIIHLKPHYQLDQLVSSIQLVTQLAVGAASGQ
ncbi:MAG: type VI secretion system contractile sheath large subunit, partial [Gammaproteobacteria bacterium]